MKVKVTITLVIDDAKKYIDEDQHDNIIDALKTDIDEGNISIDDLMVQDDVDINNLEVEEYKA